MTFKEKAKQFVREHPVDEIEDVYLAELLYYIITGKQIRLKRRKACKK